MKSTMFGRQPSATLWTASTASPCRSSTFAVPWVATKWNPMSASARPMLTIARLSRFRTERNAFPSRGRVEPAASCDFRYAVRNSRPIPITSPVDRISGPRITSTPGNFTKGKTASLTETWGRSDTSRTPSSAMRAPSITRVASLASGSPIAFDTNGTVRDARGLTSST